MTDRTFVGLAALGGAALGALSAGYYAVLAAPAAVAARPQLPDLPFWTALFSGRFAEWLFYTHTTAAVIAVVAFWILVATVGAVVMDA